MTIERIRMKDFRDIVKASLVFSLFLAKAIIKQRSANTFTNMRMQE